MTRKSLFSFRVSLVCLIAILVTGWVATGWLNQPATTYAQQNNRLVIKQSDLEVMAQDTDTAVTRALDLADTFDAYVLKQRVWDGAERRYRYATLTFGLSENDFEGLLQALRTLGTVLDESASGQDVTDQRVDLLSRLDNLYSTQERMRGFLDQAQDITETLKVHQELILIEQEIGELQGEANFLRDRSDAATITLSIVPFIPTPTPTLTATPTPSPTPTPLPTAAVWRPGDTAQTAATRLQNTSQDIADFTIYRVILCGPWLLLVLLIGYPLWRGYRRLNPTLPQLSRRRQRRPPRPAILPAPPPDATAETEAESEIDPPAPAGE